MACPIQILRYWEMTARQVPVGYNLTNDPGSIHSPMLCGISGHRDVSWISSFSRLLVRHTRRRISTKRLAGHDSRQPVPENHSPATERNSQYRNVLNDSEAERSRAGTRTLPKSSWLHVRGDDPGTSHHQQSRVGQKNRSGNLGKLRRHLLATRRA